MPSNTPFFDSFIAAISTHSNVVQRVENVNFCIVKVNNCLFIHLVPLLNHFNPTQLITLQNDFQLKNQQLIHLWEDIWESKTKQVLSRIKSLCGQNQTVHGRKTKVITIDSKQAKNFLLDNHLQGFARTKHHLGLTLDDELVAIASFAPPRLLKSKGDNYYSAELVRFACKDGITVTGGLSKLIKAYKSEFAFNDLMSYADCDWSLGNSYQQLGFKCSKRTEPISFFIENKTLHRYAIHRIPAGLKIDFSEQKELNLPSFLSKNGFTKAFNTGNLKFHLYNV